MANLNLIELLKENFKSKLEVLGYENFVDKFNPSNIFYYCYSPGEDILIELKNREIFGRELFGSSPYFVFYEKVFNCLKKKYELKNKNFEDFLRDERAAFDKSLEYEGLIEHLPQDEVNKLMRSIKDTFHYPYEFWLESSNAQMNFCESRVFIKYFHQVKEEVDMFKSVFLNSKEFNFEKFNERVFNMYGLTIPK